MNPKGESNTGKQKGKHAKMQNAMNATTKTMKHRKVNTKRAQIPNW